MRIKKYLKEKHTIISTITGLTLNTLNNAFGKNRSIVRAMPNTAISVGKSTTCLCSNSFGKTKLNLAQSIFNNLGESFIVKEPNSETLINTFQELELHSLINKINILNFLHRFNINC